MAARESKPARAFLDRVALLERNWHCLDLQYEA